MIRKCGGTATVVSTSFDLGALLESAQTWEWNAAFAEYGSKLRQNANYLQLQISLTARHAAPARPTIQVSFAFKKLRPCAQVLAPILRRGLSSGRRFARMQTP
jgi:hypothetical protein